MHKVEITLYEFDELDADTQEKVRKQSTEDFLLSYHHSPDIEEIEEILRETHYFASGAPFPSSLDNQ